MKNILTTISCALLLCSLSIQAQSYIPNEIILQFKTQTSQSYRQNLINELGSLLEDDDPNSSIIGENVLIGVDFPLTIDGQTIESEVELIGDVKRSQAAGLNSSSLNQTLSTSQLSFADFLGQAGISTYSPISAECENNYPGGELQGYITPSQTSVKVAILDTGLDPFYPSINQYVGSEVNVLADDNGGQLAISQSYNPNAPITIDNHGHGTAVAGIIAGLANRAAISPSQLEILVIKCFDANGSGTLFNMVQAISMAIRLDADIMNLSWSYVIDENNENHIAIEKLLTLFSNEHNGIIVAGAGNNSEDLDYLNLGPANFNNIDNLITVAGVGGQSNNCDGSLSVFSNYGDNVDIGAPSESMMVPGLNGYWDIDASGTSFATPIVATAVACAWLNYHANNTFSTSISLPHPAKNAVINGATPVSELNAYGIEGVVNFKNACSGDFYHNSSNNNGNNGLFTFDFLIDNNNNQYDTETESLAHVNKQAANISVSPNPFKANLTIHLPASKNKRTIEILNTQGQSLFTQQSNSQISTLQLDQLNHLPQGSYILKVHEQGSQSYQQLLIKQ